MERELLEQYETELLEKEHSGCAALMRDDKARATSLAVIPCPCSSISLSAHPSSRSASFDQMIPETALSV